MKNDKEKQKKKSRAPAPLPEDHPIKVTFTTKDTVQKDGHVDTYTFRDANNQPARDFTGAKSGDTVTWTCNEAFLVVPNNAKQFLKQDPKTPTLVTPTNPMPVAYGSQHTAGHALTLEVQEILDAGHHPIKHLGYILLAGVDCSDLKLRKRFMKVGGPWHQVSTPIVRATIILAP
jgi:hypothetical protein